MADQTDDFMAMKGAGYYSRATIGAKHVMDNAAGLILDALERREPADDGSVFQMTDMGCADGGTSIDMVGRVLGDVRRRCPSRPIQMTYTDLPKTDYSQLFQIVHGLTDTASYAEDIPELYVSASATSFHRRIVPPGTLDIGHSATASHYITEVPAVIEDHVHMVRATGETRAAFEAKGAADWENFLLMRASELKSGGFLALFNFGIDEEGRWLGHTGGVSMFDEFNRHWAAMRDEGRITSEEYRATNFPQVYRTVEQFTAPLNDAEGAVRAAGLSLEHVETRVVRCPYAEAFEAGEYADAAAFAKAYIPTLRSWSEPVFVNGLSGRPAAERTALVDEFYGRYEAAVAADPAGHGMDYVHCYLICRKD
ncbi:MAG: SAM-dependent methyltransferase [Pseudomonadota bacterium]